MIAWGLIWTLVRTDFKVRYHGKLIGFIWALVKPVVMYLVLSGVFSFIFATEGLYRSKLLLGLILWDFFAEATKVSMTSLAAKGFLIGKSRFPRWIIVVTSVSNPLLTLMVTTCALLAFIFVRHQVPSLPALGLFLLYELVLVAVVIGFGLATSALFLEYRDLNELWDLISYAGFFLAPVIYPLAVLPEKYHLYLYLWPPTSIIQFSRAVLLDGTIPSARAHLLMLVMTAAIFSTGLLLFKKHAPRAAEHL